MRLSYLDSHEATSINGGRPSVVSDVLVQIIGPIICERLHFTISELSREFRQISDTVLYEIITVRLDSHNLVQDGLRKY
jgi:hypothetical protein